MARPIGRAIAGAIIMSAVGWKSLVRLLQGVSTRARRPRTRSPKGRKITPGLESLELISLLSSIGPPIGAAAMRLHDARVHRLARHFAGGPGAGATETVADPAPVTLPAQTASLGNTLTSFTNQPLSPALNLFDPSLGTLVSVVVSHAATLQSTITSQNLSTTSATVITVSLSGSYQINGLNQPIVQPTQTSTSQPQAAGVFGSSSDTVTFPPLLLNSSASSTFSDPASVAFFTASPGRTTITPTMTATASGSASAPNGNLRTTALTSASSMVTVTYTYIPPAPAACPGTGRIGRIGVHHQRTLLILPFVGPVNPVLAGTPGDYFVISRAGRRIPIVSADYNPSTNSVTLRTAHPLDVHERFHLSVTLPCPNGATNMVVHIPFGTKYSLIGFHDKRGDFVAVQDGRIVRSLSRSRQEDRHRPGRSR